MVKKINPIKSKKSGRIAKGWDKKKKQTTKVRKIVKSCEIANKQKKKKWTTNAGVMVEKNISTKIIKNICNQGEKIILQEPTKNGKVKE